MNNQSIRLVSVAALLAFNSWGVYAGGSGGTEKAYAVSNLVMNAPVTGVTNTWRNELAFGVILGPGTSGPCSGKDVQFYAANFANSDEYKRAFGVALTAYSLGKRVDVYVYAAGESRCDMAQYIAVHD